VWPASSGDSLLSTYCLSTTEVSHASVAQKVTHCVGSFGPLGRKLVLSRCTDADRQRESAAINSIVMVGLQVFNRLPVSAERCS